jgi:CRP-like cAMP-binding protein
MRLLVLSPREFDSLHRVAPCVAYRMLRELAARLRQSDEMNDRRSDQRVGVAL